MTNIDVVVVEHPTTLSDYSIHVNGEQFATFFPYVWKEARPGYGGYVVNDDLIKTARLMSHAPELFRAVKALIDSPSSDDVELARTLIKHLEGM